MPRGIKKKTPPKHKAGIPRRAATRVKAVARKKTGIAKHPAPVKKLGKKKTILSTLLGVVLLGGAGF